MLLLQRFGGYAAIGNALIYIFMFIYYGALVEYPAHGSVTEKMQFLSQHVAELSVVNIVGYILFGVLLAVLVQAGHARLRVHHALLSQTAMLFGAAWVVVIISAGMIANVSLTGVVALNNTEPEQARAVWLATNLVQQALGGGIEILGGLWALLLSLGLWRAGQPGRAVHGLGILTGLAGIMTLIPLDIFTEVFGLMQIVWFAWLGVTLLRQPHIAPIAATQAGRSPVSG